MTKTRTIQLSLVAVTAISLMMVSTPALAESMGFLDIKKAKVEADIEGDDDPFEFDDVKIKTKKKIPTDGSGGAFGYGIISGAGLEAIAVSTTHAGVLDSDAQANKDDPVFHNHYVALHDLPDDDKCPGLEVRDITFQEPGEVEKVKKKKIKLDDIPFEFSGTHSLTGDPISFEADHNISAVVSFTIDPVDSTGTTNPDDIQAVCINDVKPADKLKIEIDDED